MLRDVHCGISYIVKMANPRRKLSSHVKAISENNSPWPFCVLHNMEGAEAMWVTQNHRAVANLWLDGEVRYTEVESSSDKRKELLHSGGRHVADGFFSNSPCLLSEGLLKHSLQHAKMCISLLSVDTGMATVNPSICPNSQRYLWALPQALAITARSRLLKGESEHRIHDHSGSDSVLPDAPKLCVGFN